MRLSASIALTLLAYHQLSSTSEAFKQDTKPARNAAAAQSILQKKEGAAARNRNGNGQDKKNGSTDASGTITATSAGASRGGSRIKTNNGQDKKTTRGGGNPYKARGNGRLKKDNGIHSAHLDANDSGITLDAVEYTYGTPVVANFELTNDLIPTDVLETLKIENMDSWTMGVFMRMANPQCGAVQPIVSVTPSIDDAGGSTTRQRERKLLRNKSIIKGRTKQDEDDTELPSGGYVYQEGDAPPQVQPGMDDTDLDTSDPAEVPNFGHVGSATITSTAITDLNPNDVGTGMDVYLLDENGCAIIGPATFYMIETASMAAANEEKAKGKGKHSHPLAKYGIKKKKKHSFTTSGKGKAKVMGGAPDKDLGKGSGSNGSMILGDASPPLAEYVLHTLSTEYVLGDTVTVTYDLSPEVVIEGARRMLQRNKVGTNGIGKVKNGNGGGNGGRNSSNGGGSTPVEEEITTTTSSTVDSTTTTTTAELDTSTGGVDPDDEDDGTIVIVETEPEIDLQDKTLFSLGVYMRMAHPQGGDLAPILSVPFCTDPTNCGKTDEELAAGDLTFDSTDLNVDENGSGYDVWILNGEGGGVAGPFTFYIVEDEDSV